MRVVAIKDAPIIHDTRLLSRWQTNKLLKEFSLTQAYKVGDIFDVSKLYSDPKHHRTYMVIFNHHIGSYMEVNYDNFIPLDEHRENQINELLST